MSIHPIVISFNHKYRVMTSFGEAHVQIQMDKQGSQEFQENPRTWKMQAKVKNWRDMPNKVEDKLMRLPREKSNKKE